MYGVLAIVCTVVLALRLTIPESEIWLKAHADRKAGIVTEASKVGIGDLFKNKEYALPFIALIISFNVKFAFILLALFCVIGFASAILVFRNRRYNTFEEEEAAVEVAETSEAK